MCAGQWQGNGQPRFSRVPGPSSVDVDFTNHSPHPTSYSTLSMGVGNKRLKYRWKFKKVLVVLSFQPTWGALFITQFLYGPLNWAHNTEPNEVRWAYLSLRVWDRNPRLWHRRQGGEIGKLFPGGGQEGERMVPRGWLMSQGSISVTLYHIHIFHCISLVQKLPIIKWSKWLLSEATVRSNTNNADLTHSLTH